MLNMIKVRLLEYKAMFPVVIAMTIMAVAFIYVFGIGFGQTYQPPVAIVDEDRSEESRRVVESLIGEKEFETKEYILDEAVNLLESSKVIAVIVIPENYSQDIKANTGTIQFIKISTVMEHYALELALSAIIDRVYGNEEFLNRISQVYTMTNLEMNKENMLATINDTYKDRPMLKTIATAYESDSANYYDSLKQSFMGFILFFSMFTMVFGIGGIVENKQTRVWHRQIVSPIPSHIILGSALIVGFAVGFFQISIMVLTGTYIFDIDLGKSTLALLLVISAYIMAAMSLGFFISSLVKTEQQLSAFTPMIIVSTSMLGGCMWPLEMVSNNFIRTLSIITPQRWAMEGLQQVIIFNGDIGNVIEPITYMLILAIIFFLMAIVPYKKVA